MADAARDARKLFTLPGRVALLPRVLGRVLAGVAGLARPVTAELAIDGGRGVRRRSVFMARTDPRRPCCDWASTRSRIACAFGEREDVPCVRACVRVPHPGRVPRQTTRHCCRCRFLYHLTVHALCGRLYDVDAERVAPCTPPPISTTRWHQHWRRTRVDGGGETPTYPLDQDGVQQWAGASAATVAAAVP